MKIGELIYDDSLTNIMRPLRVLVRRTSLHSENVD